MSHASITVTVDAQLHWVVRVPEVPAGATRAVIELLSGPPDLPFIGEPFGGDGGTD